jgi:single-strand DNA-binding protein
MGVFYMLTINKVTIIGYVGKDPTFYTFQSGNQCANFSVATSESWIDKKTGEKRQITEWHRVISFTAVDFIREHIHSGDPVYLEGALRKREYIDNKTGEKKQITEIVISPRGKVNLLDSIKNVLNEPEEISIPPVINDFPKEYSTEDL